jgi:hypothetical protein
VGDTTVILFRSMTVLAGDWLAASALLYSVASGKLMDQPIVRINIICQED